MTDDISPDDLAALQQLRLARRRSKRMEKEYERANRKMIKAQNKLFERLAFVQARGLDTNDPISLD